jgi:hypothetical protein
MKAGSKKKNRSKVFKRYLTGSIWSGFAAKRGLKLLGYQLVFVFLFLIIGSALTFENDLLRIVSNLSLVAACGALLYMDGARHGEADVAYAEIAYQHKERGMAISPSEISRCFHPLKGGFTVLAGMLPVLILAGIHASLARLQTFSLGVLPNWVSAYEHRAGIGTALSFYNRHVQISAIDIIRIIIRMLIYPFVNMAGTENTPVLLLTDRLSPLLVLVIPALYAVGYIQGKNIRALVHGSISTNARRRRNKLLKTRKAQQQKTHDII